MAEGSASGQCPDTRSEATLSSASLSIIQGGVNGRLGGKGTSESQEHPEAWAQPGWGVRGELEPRSAPWAPGPLACLCLAKLAAKGCCRQLVPVTWTVNVGSSWGKWAKLLIAHTPSPPSFPHPSLSVGAPKPGIRIPASRRAFCSGWRRLRPVREEDQDTCPSWDLEQGLNLTF